MFSLSENSQNKFDPLKPVSSKGEINCCLTFALGVLGLAILIGFGLRSYVGGVIEDNTVLSPQLIAGPPVSSSKAESVADRVKAFMDQVKEGQASEPLILSSDDFHTLLAGAPRFLAKEIDGEIQSNQDLSAGEKEQLAEFTQKLEELSTMMRLEISGDSLQGKVSIPISIVVPLDWFGFDQERYANADTAFTLNYDQGKLDLNIKSLIINGEELPSEVLAEAESALIEILRTSQESGKPSVLEQLGQYVRKIEIKNDSLTAYPRTQNY